MAKNFEGVDFLASETFNDKVFEIFDNQFEKKTIESLKYPENGSQIKQNFRYFRN